MFEHNIKIHKQKKYSRPPKVSLILLDWGVREHFQALYWLQKQDVERDDYELIWVEVHDKVAEYTMEHADTVITCGYRGRYHKHVAYNEGLLEAQGDLVSVADSDAVFPENFISSILNHFEAGERQYNPLVLMHYEARTNVLFPGNENIKSIEQVKTLYPWEKLWENVGACMTVRKSDAVNFGGFDEHRSLRGFYCGPYDLGWRLINAGVPEIWEDPEKCIIWHFSHPAPYSSACNDPNLKHSGSDRHNMHIAGHALTSIESFSCGRLLPRKENKRLHDRRMTGRRIGSDLEKQYSKMSPPEGFSVYSRFQIYLLNVAEKMGHKMLYSASLLRRTICFFGGEKHIPKMVAIYKKIRSKLINIP